MRIMGSSGPREDAHWGQCFEEFYGPEYCKNLKKDLEKLKDEFYDGNAQRFQREWVVPTANLLRRMRHMGFPVRTRDHIIIHLYNPVDSMFAGEMHFQVGRKAPGTLTLKFTKQNSNGLFVIQPKTLSNADEAKLQQDPLDFLDHVRMDMRDTAIDISNLLRTLVLMTETCKLQRQCAKVFFSNVKENFGRSSASLNNHPVHDILPTPHFAATSNQWPPGVVNQDSIRQDASFPFPLNFCVKNYVNYGNPKPEINPQNVLGSTHYRLPNGPQMAGAAYRQSRSSTLHSEPEENDETMNLQSFTENNWPCMPPDSLEEIQRRMSDTRLWEASKGAGPLTDLKPVNDLAYGQHFRHYGQAIPETKVWGGETRTSLTDEYTGDIAGEATESTWRVVEQRTADTEAYVQGAPEMQASICKNSGERTWATEDYASEPAAAMDRTQSVFKGTFSDAIASGHRGDVKTDPSGSVSPRTAVVNDYAGDSQNPSGSQNANSYKNASGLQPSGGPRYPFVPWQMTAMMQSSQQGAVAAMERKCSVPGVHLTPDTSEGRRTSSLDAYVGNGSSGLKVSPGDPRARSEGNLATPRTNTVDQYFQSQTPDVLTPPSYFWHVPLAREATNGYGPVNGNVQHMSRALPRSGPEESANSLDSWASHTGSASLMVQNNRLRASSFGAGPLRGQCADEEDMSLLSHTSYPSWGSHPAVHIMNAGAGMLPLTIEQINNDAHNWQKYAPENSLN